MQWCRTVPYEPADHFSHYFRQHACYSWCILGDRQASVRWPIQRYDSLERLLEAMNRHRRNGRRRDKRPRRASKRARVPPLKTSSNKRYIPPLKTRPETLERQLVRCGLVRLEPRIRRVDARVQVLVILHAQASHALENGLLLGTRTVPLSLAVCLAG